MAILIQQQKNHQSSFYQIFFGLNECASIYTNKLEPLRYKNYWNF